jgi:hypothetical protein
VAGLVAVGRTKVGEGTGVAVGVNVGDDSRDGATAVGVAVGGSIVADGEGVETACWEVAVGAGTSAVAVGAMVSTTRSASWTAGVGVGMGTGASSAAVCEAATGTDEGGAATVDGSAIDVPPELPGSGGVTTGVCRRAMRRGVGLGSPRIGGGAGTVSISMRWSPTSRSVRAGGERTISGSAGVDVSRAEDSEGAGIGSAVSDSSRDRIDSGVARLRTNQAAIRTTTRADTRAAARGDRFANARIAFIAADPGLETLPADATGAQLARHMEYTPVLARSLTGLQRRVFMNWKGR